MNRVVLLSAIILLALGAKFIIEGILNPEREPLPPKRPLSELPSDILGEGWRSEDLPLEERVIKISGVSDYVYRRFTSGKQDLVLWVGYVMRNPSEGLHHPGVCFPLQGFRLENQGSVAVSGTGLPNVPRFAETTWTMNSSRVYCLYSFYYHGEFIPEPLKLRFWEKVSQPKYFAIISLSGNFDGPRESSIRDRCLGALQRIIPSLLEHFPEESSDP